jgi:hypothetical protein
VKRTRNVIVNVVVIALVVALALALEACRRKHVAPIDTTEPPPVAAAAPPTANAPPPSGNSANPLNEPVLAPPSSDRPMPDGGTLNDDPRGPRPAEWQTIVDRHMSLLQACFDRADLPPGEITVNMHYTVELPGYTGAVTANGKAPRAVLDCCIKVVEDMKFPEYRGTKVERDLGFTWAKRVVGRPDGGATAATKK